MNINRSNYEEFFLLYVDGELSAKDMQAVEQFVTENPELADELDALKQTIQLPDENLYFENKEELYRTTSLHINEINYLNFFLLYVDGELNDTQRKEVEKFAASHPQMQNELNLLLASVVKKENIIFENKESLYRHEERKPAPVFSLTIRRFAVAAAFVAIAVAAWILTQNKSTVTVASNSPKNSNDIAIVKPPTDSSEKKNEADKIIVPAEIKSQKTFAAAPGNKSLKKNDAVFPPAKNIAVNNKKEEQDNINKDNNKEVLIAQNKPDENTTTPSNTYFSGLNNSKTQTNVNDGHSTVTYAENSRSSNTKNNTTTDNTMKVIPAAYKQINTEEDINNRNLYVGALNLNKDKVKGLFRKVTGLFNQKAKQVSENNDVKFAGIPLNQQ